MNAPDSVPPTDGTEQEAGSGEQIVRRVEITVEREITTVVRRVWKPPVNQGEEPTPD
jgi:hypothetical protein